MLILFYSALGTVKIKELIEEYILIFDTLDDFKKNINQFKNYNFENIKSKNYFISRLLK